MNEPQANHILYAGKNHFYCMGIAFATIWGVLDTRAQPGIPHEAARKGEIITALDKALVQAAIGEDLKSAFVRFTPHSPRHYCIPFEQLMQWPRQWKLVREYLPRGDINAWSYLINRKKAQRLMAVAKAAPDLVNPVHVYIRSTMGDYTSLIGAILSNLSHRKLY